MAALLSRFRIDYSDVYVIPDLAKKPNQNTIREFEELISPFRINTDENAEESQIYITDSEHKALKGKVNRIFNVFFKTIYEQGKVCETF